eukprot:CAMPEP_0116960314 /NCGR_PEP_ID=MMETSP0467-20121206/45867_1 /TAXON_ID=283647 /ORGANISM="Mesodinium pulex, Strain SPMC105" /LENGTH=123 /DNA_ID=CAMNT_0004647979 /DNA_START=852 /DNA_END=1223 /DNA_ORIENTATION=+
MVLERGLDRGNTDLVNEQSQLSPHSSCIWFSNYSLIVLVLGRLRAISTSSTDTKFYSRLRVRSLVQVELMNRALVISNLLTSLDIDSGCYNIQSIRSCDRTWNMGFVDKSSSNSENEVLFFER